MRRGFLTSVLLTVVLLIAALPSGGAALGDGRTAQAPSLNEVLARAAHYVTTFHRQLSGIVAEEIYVQSARTMRRASSLVDSRTLKSDFLLVRPPEADRYVEFRDVFEVDGIAVRDRDERLTELFLTPTRVSGDRIRAIIDESARHNIGDIPRNVNTPMLTLYFLQQDMQRHFRFRRAKAGQPQLGNAAAVPGRSAAVFRVTTEMWVIDYRETERPTIIKTDRGRDFPASGRFWIDPETGAVLMSELVMENSEVTAMINVSYQSEPILGFLVPVEMRERYRARDERVEGVATYGRFRQVQVKTGETIAKPPGGH